MTLEYIPPTLYKNNKGEIVRWEDLTAKEKRAVRISKLEEYEKKIMIFTKENFTEMTNLLAKIVNISKKKAKKEIEKFLEKKLEFPLEKSIARIATKEEINIARDKYRNFLKKEIERIIIDFPLEEKKILNMRLGLDNDIMSTPDEIIKKFGVTRERIRKIEAKVFQRIKKSYSLKKKMWIFKQ